MGVSLSARGVVMAPAATWVRLTETLTDTYTGSGRGGTSLTSASAKLDACSPSNIQALLARKGELVLLDFYSDQCSCRTTRDFTGDFKVYGLPTIDLATADFFLVNRSEKECAVSGCPLLCVPACRAKLLYRTYDYHSLGMVQVVECSY